MKMVRTRIAPSPTGIAHIGTAYIALLNFAFAKGNQGKFVLRIEDTDRQRYKEGSEAVIFAALRWLDLSPDEGPQEGGPYGPYVQSQRLPLYSEHAQKLIDAGNAYYCFCSPQRLEEMRRRQQQQGKIPMYDGTCRKLDTNEARVRATKEPHVIRLKVERTGTTKWNDLIRKTISIRNQSIDDQVLLKSDGFPTYHLAVVVDDHLMEVSHVIRGEEWISSTPKHILLYRAFGWKVPQFAHTPLLRNPDRSKLSKRRDPVSVLEYRDKGFLPECLVNELALMGWSHPQGKEKFSLEEFIANFTLERIQTSGPVFDLGKLRWLNGLYIREKTSAQLAKLIQPFAPKGADPKLMKAVIPLVRERIHTLSEFPDYTDFFFTRPQLEPTLLLQQSQHSPVQTLAKLKEFSSMLETQKAFSASRLEQLGKSLVSNSWSTTKLLMTVRVALTGKTVTPPLFETMEILGKKETLERLRHACDLLNQASR